jgi:hypothetical protein
VEERIYRREREREREMCDLLGGTAMSKHRWRIGLLWDGNQHDI